MRNARRTPWGYFGQGANKVSSNGAAGGWTAHNKQVSDQTESARNELLNFVLILLDWWNPPRRYRQVLRLAKQATRPLEDTAELEETLQKLKFLVPMRSTTI